MTMSQLLIHEPPLQVLPSLAVAVGLNEALLLQQVHYWLQRSTTRIGGHVWVYNSVRQWRDQFPFWSDDTISRGLKSLRARGVLIADQLSKDPRDRSLYYRIDYQILQACTTAICGNGLSQIAAISNRSETTTETTTETPSAPKGPKAGLEEKKQDKARAAITLKAWLEEIKAKKEDAIPASGAVMSYADSIKLPDHMLALAWATFKSRHMDGAKKYKDWRRTFLDHLKNNYLRLWWIDGEGHYQLTTQGKQAEMIHGGGAA